MNQFTIKHFHKKDAIKLLIVYPSRKWKLVWALPDNDLVKYKGYEFKINEKDFILDNKNTPCYIVDTGNIEVKDPYSPNKINKIISPEELNTAISARVATEIFNTMKSAMDKSTIAIIVGVMGIAITLVGIYLLMGRLDELQSLLELIGGM